MSESTKTVVSVYRVPGAVKQALIDRAIRDGVSMNDAAVEPLARRYKVPFVAGQSGRAARARADGATAQVMLKMPVKVKRGLERESYRERRSETAIVIEAIASFLGVPKQPAVRRGRPRRAAAA